DARDAMRITRARCLASAFTALWLVVIFGGFAVAQSVGKIKRIGYLASGSRTFGLHESFQQGLRELGWVAGQNIEIEYRFADGRFERLPELVAELVRLKVDVIVAQPTTAAQAAKNATSTLPIVMINVGDPVGIGLVDSLARPGGNVTGPAFGVGLESIPKGLELLKEAVPGVRQIAVLSNPANPAQSLAIQDVKVAAQSLGLRLLLFEARGPQEFDRVFAAMAKEGADGLLVVAESLFISHRTTLAARALQQRLPSMHGVRENVDAGGLMSYGPSLHHSSRRAAAFVDKILKGAKPADLPVEQPTKFELVINLKTARELGLVIPPSLLLRADQVIE
ncbi:MAG: ABC transporter substrate-binding protein, partial [Caldimonas sp.]